MKKLTDELRQTIWSYTDANGMAIPYLGKPDTPVPPELWLDPAVQADLLPDPLPFGFLDESIRDAVSLWLLENVIPAPDGTPAAYVSSSVIGAMLKQMTGIELNDIQVQEALLLLGIEPYDCERDDWVYRIRRDCQCASSESVGLKTMAHSLYVVKASADFSGKYPV